MVQERPRRNPHGYIFAALSRATSLDGLSFTAPLTRRDIIVDVDLERRIRVDERV
jgi:hypothetical protein